MRCCDWKMQSCEFLNLKSMVREGESNLFYCKYVQGLYTTEGGSKGDRNEIWNDKNERYPKMDGYSQEPNETVKMRNYVPIWEPGSSTACRIGKEINKKFGTSYKIKSSAPSKNLAHSQRNFAAIAENSTQAQKNNLAHIKYSTSFKNIVHVKLLKKLAQSLCT